MSGKKNAQQGGSARRPYLLRAGTQNRGLCAVLRNSEVVFYQTDTGEAGKQMLRREAGDREGNREVAVMRA